jgi:hypothetical protein
LEGNERYTSSFPEVDPYEGTPLRLNTLFNTLVRDFLKARELAGGGMSEIQPNWVGYYVTNYLEIRDKEKMGSGMDIPGLFALWEEGVAGLSQTERQQVREITRGFPRLSFPFVLIRKFARKKGLLPFYSAVMGKIRNVRQRLLGNPVDATVFEAALRTNGVLTGDPGRFKQ